MAQARAQPDDAAASVVTCTDVNQASGAILVTRTAKNPNLCAGPHPLAGTTFMVNGCPGNRCQRAGLLRRAHRWDGVHRDREAAPAGTSIDTTFKSVTPTSPDSRMSGTPDRVCFTDSPLTDVLAKAPPRCPGRPTPRSPASTTAAATSETHRRVQPTPPKSQARHLRLHNHPRPVP